MKRAVTHFYGVFGKGKEKRAIYVFSFWSQFWYARKKNAVECFDFHPKWKGKKHAMASREASFFFLFSFFNFNASHFVVHKSFYQANFVCLCCQFLILNAKINNIATNILNVDPCKKCKSKRKRRKKKKGWCCRWINTEMKCQMIRNKVLAVVPKFLHHWTLLILYLYLLNLCLLPPFCGINVYVSLFESFTHTHTHTELLSIWIKSSMNFCA